MIFEKLFNKLDVISRQNECPIFYYSTDVIDHQIQSLYNFIPNFAELSYSLKANSNDQLINYLIEKIDFFDVASIGELELLTEKKINPKRIHFTGPGKSFTELQRAIELNIGEIVVESIIELDFIADYIFKINSLTKVLLRVNLSNSSNFFGIDEKEILNILTVPKYQQLIIGLHYHQKSQFESNDHFIKHLKKCCNHFDSINILFPNNCKILNFGSGFSVPYYTSDKKMDLNLIKEAMSVLFLKYKTLGIKLQFESGRFIVAGAGFYCTKVLYLKQIQDKNIIVVDGGLYHFMAATGVGKILRKNFPISVISQKTNKSSPPKKYTIIGNTCSELDIFADEIYLSEINVGDIIVIHNAGAYALQYSPINFIRHNIPIEIIGHDDI